MPGPNLTRGAAFFPNVLKDAKFIKDGILFGTEPAIQRGCHWVVIDPNRHQMRMYERTGFPSESNDIRISMQGMNTTAFSGGPHYIHAGGNSTLQKIKSQGMYYLGKALPYGGNIIGGEYLQKKALADFLSVPEGVIRGSRVKNVEAPEAIANYRAEYRGRAPNNNCNYYFGRNGSDASYQSYEIGGPGDPPARLTEAFGRLPIAVDNYKNVDYLTDNNRRFLWCLAPLNLSAKADPAVKAAVASYVKSAVRSKPPKGLILGIWYQGTSQAGMLAAAGVQWAVHLDGSDSAFLGYGSMLLAGKNPGTHKVVACRYGVAFYSAK
jgi:hypothetical protein